MKLPSSLLTAAALFFTTGATSIASSIWQENFLYPDGGLISVSGGNWTMLNGTALPIQVSSNSITLQEVTSGTSGEDLKRALDTGYTSGALYVGAIVTLNSAPTAANGDYFLSFYSSASSGGGFAARIFASATSTGWSFGLANGGSTPTDWTADLTAGQAYKIIVKLDVTTQTSTLGVFDLSYVPTSDSELTVAGAGTSSVTQAIDNFAVRQGSTSGTVFSENVGAIWTGTELTDVASVAAVPEPATVAMVGLGITAVLFGMRARRRS